MWTKFLIQIYSRNKRLVKIDSLQLLCVEADMTQLNHVAPFLHVTIEVDNNIGGNRKTAN